MQFLLFLFGMFVSVYSPVPATVPPVVFSVPQKIVYLTFDADMTPKMALEIRQKKVQLWYDPALLTYLTSERIPFTIFMTGMFAEQYPETARSLAKNPRVSIQNHSYDHFGFVGQCFRLAVLTTDRERRREIERTQIILKKMTGRTPTLFRYPGLCRSAETDVVVNNAGLTVSDGTLISGDAFAHDPQKIVTKILFQVRAGSEIVLHLGGPNAPSTTTAVRTVVPLLMARGFSFATLP